MENKMLSVEKYFILSYKENGECVGWLSAYSASGANQFAPQSHQAVYFDSEQECIYSDGQKWEEGNGQKGYYKIEKRKILVEEVNLKPYPDDLIKVIAQACLKHSDSGEASFNKEARVILMHLENNGYTIIKKK